MPWPASSWPRSWRASSSRSPGAASDDEGRRYRTSPSSRTSSRTSEWCPKGSRSTVARARSPPEPKTAILEDAAKAAGCDLQLDLPDEGNTHFTNEDKEVDYKTNPPTSGDHYGDPTETGTGALADGAYLETPPITRAVHSLEHGRVEIQYSPGLSESDQLAIKGVFEESPQGVIMFPNPDMPYDVAITAWTQLAGCDAYEGAATLDLLRTFRDIYRGQAPEFVPLSI